MNNVKIALVQMKSQLYDISYNINKIIKFTENAAKNNVDIVCFPEASLCGYTSEFNTKYSLNINSEVLNILKNKCRLLQITILVGIVEACDGNNFITQVVIHNTGEIEKYRKIHLGTNGEKIFKRGNNIPIFKFEKNNKTIKFGIGICYDLHFPELVTALSFEGVKLIFAPHASPLNINRRLELWNKYLTARAYDNRIYVAACNLIFDNELDNKGGGIGIWGNNGDLLIQTNEAKDELIYYTIDINELYKYDKDDKDNKDKNKNYICNRQLDLYLSTRAFNKNIDN